MKPRKHLAFFWPQLIEIVDAVRVSASAYITQSRAAKRVAYAARFIYWTLNHRSPKHAAWVCAFEGYSL